MRGSSPIAGLPADRARYFHNDVHQRHAPATEWGGSGLIECAEIPSRVTVIEQALTAAGAQLEVAPPADRRVLQRIHSTGYLDFLENAVRDWTAAGLDLPVLAGTFAPRDSIGSVPKAILGRAGFYSFGMGSPILDGTWEAALGAAGCAIAAMEAVREGASLAFALCRPPGHHASRELGGGYCYINNAALAADLLADGAARRGGVAIVDLDYHHGNGTQEIFWDRDDVTYFSIHADPDHEYPYFTGRRFEEGAGPGRGLTINEPLPLGTGDAEWLAALDRGVDSMIRPDYVVVSLGLDAAAGDERFEVTRDGFAAAGRHLSTFAPLVVLLEGGYRIDDLGPNALAFLSGALGST